MEIDLSPENTVGRGIKKRRETKDNKREIDLSPEKPYRARDKKKKRTVEEVKECGGRRQWISRRRGEERLCDPHVFWSVGPRGNTLMTVPPPLPTPLCLLASFSSSIPAYPFYLLSSLISSFVPPISFSSFGDVLIITVIMVSK